MLQKQSSLTWGLQICTYQRAEMLQRCISCALGQSVAPAEIVIVDASDDWQMTRDRIAALAAQAPFAVRLVYEAAEVRSLPHQRNQALRHMTCDIVFAIDDDSLMYPDCAEKILEIYESDKARLVAGVGAEERSVPPDAAGDRDDQLNLGACCRQKSAVRLFFEAQLAMKYHFVPYDGWRKRNIRVQGAYPVHLNNGFCTTFRREYGVRVGWSEVLRFYALHEDGDFNYRLSEFGALVRAEKAFLCHMQAPGGRLSRRVVNRLRVLNLLALHKTHSLAPLSSALAILRSFLRFAALYLIIDPAQRRFTLPTVRSYLYGITMIPVMLFGKRENFAAFYRSLQEQTLKL
jgi:GT2 family glycosyltransferase